MKNPTIITITVCDEGYNLNVYERYSEFRGAEFQFACESFESLVTRLIRHLGLRNEYEVIIKIKEK